MKVLENGFRDKVSTRDDDRNDIIIIFITAEYKNTLNLHSYTPYDNAILPDIHTAVNISPFNILSSCSSLRDF